ncbi:MAG: hypothetical protein LHW57_04140 [Candidatus Cloacimonetes bacterium]|nr:hypothetical protein [Candidatus Cloacimonadota bacterium]
MKKILLLIVALVLLSIPGCRFSKSYNTHELKLSGISRRKEVAYSWRFGDLAGKGYDHQLSAAPIAATAHMLLVRDQIGKDISQINLPQKIRGVNVLADPRDHSPWLFLSVNDQKATSVLGFKYVWENVLKREEKVFAAIARTDSLINRADFEWLGNLRPVLLEDIDQDGGPELVCLAQDAYTVNPRGLIVYDFDSGALKWRFDLTTTVTSLVCDDFDGDGAKELVCGTIAFKNTNQELRGMDDSHSWLFVLDSQGVLLHYQLVNTGYSGVQLSAADLDNDGTSEILAVSSTKGNAVTPNTVKWMNWTGSRFVPRRSWELSGNFSGNAAENLYNDMGNSGRNYILLTALNSPLLALDRDLNPVRHHFRDPVSYVWAVEDLDLDGEKEILLQTVDNRFVVLNSDLKATAELRNPYTLDDDYRVDIVGIGSGRPREIAISSSTDVQYFSYQSLPLGVLIGRMIGANLAFLAIFQALLLLALIIFILHRRKVFLMAMNSVGQGMIVMVSDDRIIIINRYLQDLLKDDQGKLPPGNLRSLANLFPAISALLPDFIRSQAPVYKCTLSLGRNQLRHLVKIQKLRGLVTRFLITLRPEVPDLDSTTLAWADTARRLSHNVRRHITNIILALKPLQADGRDETQKKYAEIIRSEIEKIRIFTHAFQRFTELKDYDLKLQDVIPSVEHCLERLSIPAGIKLIKNWELASVEAWIEPIRFEEALSNVVTNALDAMPRGGNLHLSVKKFPNHAGGQGGLSVMIEVEDSGVGIPAKYADEIWQPFFTTKDSGTGIGLPETKKIIESMGGTVLVQSEEGFGTVVTFWLKGSPDG